ncbi:small integral C4-dicarboxylate membrane transport protein [Psychromonas sp. CNPT3]|uniref:TRAP transporter small permease n=1 Tax=Psychromonas sp. CNPT3 TaxID=314282 RepID=UPI0002C115D4|nr:TRAP transporter small permease [Psychromonas sp. CNPT3]AGH81323.1 small integral C4-dicarboxylate membrane transport protein [Psychromonas sp. CNPT3]
MQLIVKVVDKLLVYFTVSLSVLLVFCVIWQVISRYVIGIPSTFTDEMARFLFMWVGLIGAAYTTGQKKHLAIDLLTLKLQGTRKLISEITILVLMLTFSTLIMIYGGGGLMLKTLSTGQVSPALGIEMGYVYLVLPLSGAIMTFYCLMFLIDPINKLLYKSANNSNKECN